MARPIYADPAEAGGSPLIAGYVLDDFEHGMRIIRPDDPAEERKQFFVNVGGGTSSVSSAQAYEGTSSLAIPHVSGDYNEWYFNTYTDALSGWTQGWKRAYRFVENWTLASPSGYNWPALGNINRFRFWIRLPNGYSLAGTGGNNFEFGTYLKGVENTAASTDPNNWPLTHHYHFLNLKTAGNRWQHVIIDNHPNHYRGANGDTEHDAITLGQAETGMTYHDSWFQWYLGCPYDSVAGTFYIDGMEFYVDPNDENIEQIYSLNGVYQPSTNEVHIGWMADKNDGSVAHDVRYSFSSIHTSGWTGTGTAAAPSGTGIASAAGNGGANSRSYTNTTIDVGSNEWIFMGVKPQDSSRFREIAIPLT